jgi:hypothetical protein
MRTRQGWLGDRRGVVMLEFLLAFVPIFVLFLGLLQLALLEVADLVVRHAAVAGARSASVVLYDDPQYYAGAAVGDASEASPRLAVVRGAVQVRMAAIAPAWPALEAAVDPARRPSVADALGPADAARLGFALFAYLPATLAIAFPREPGSDELLDDLGASDALTVRVTQLVPCAVPVAGALLCRRFDWDGSQLRARSGGAGAQRALAELKRAPLAPLQALLAASGLPLAVLRAEATLPAQRADYSYRSARDQDDEP